MARFSSWRCLGTGGIFLLALGAVSAPAGAVHTDARLTHAHPTRASFTLAAREVVIPAPGSPKAANPDPLALPAKPYCPKTLYGKWYPFSRAAVATLGIMEIKKGHISFSKHDAAPFKIRRGPRNIPYLELFDLPQQQKYGYLLDRFAFIGYDAFQVLDNACMIQVSLCVAKSDVEKRIKHDWLPKSAPEDYYCSGVSYVPYRSKERLKKYLFDYSHDK